MISINHVILNVNKKWKQYKIVEKCLLTFTLLLHVQKKTLETKNTSRDSKWVQL